MRALSVVALWLASLAISGEAACGIAPSFPPWQMASEASATHCERVGFPNLDRFRGAHDVGGTYIPFLSSVPLTTENQQITQAVIWIHGLEANANKYFCDGVAAAWNRGAAASTATVAPWFGMERIKRSVWQPQGEGDDRMSTCWAGFEWLTGADSSNEEQDSVISSFTVLDEIANLLLDKSKFPNLKKVSFAGFSAGCQMLVRWALFSEVAKQATVIASDCATYPYLDARRPAPCCSPLANTGAHHSCSHFIEPEAAACPNFNKYKLGLDMAGLPGMSYFREVLASEEHMRETIRSFAAKDVRYLHGVDDACQCMVEGHNNGPPCYPKGQMCWPTVDNGCCDTYPDSHSANAVDFDCGAQLQGSNRLQRVLNYISYLRRYFGAQGVAVNHTVAFFEGGHDSTGWSLDALFAEWVGWQHERMHFTL